MLNFGVLHGWLVDLLYWQVGMSHEQAGKVHVQAGGIHVLNGRLSWQVGRAHGLDEGVAGLAVRGVHLKVRWIHTLHVHQLVQLCPYCLRQLYCWVVRVLCLHFL